MEVQEVFMMEKGEFVGYTATVDPRNGSICEIADCKPPAEDGEYPPFDKNDVGLLDAGRATACLVVTERFAGGTYKDRFGTAFFVTSSRLVTAGHNVQRSRGADAITDLRISYAGWKEVTEKANTLDCKVIGNLYEPGSDPGSNDSNTDLAVLECPQHNANVYLKLSRNLAALKKDAFVDVIGYPQHLNGKQRESFIGLGATPTTIGDAEKMLPASTLTATRGRIKCVRNGIFMYNNSTVPGMSGACVLFNGHVYGVHLGQSGQLNHAISFESPEIRAFLKEHIIVTYPVDSGFLEIRAGPLNM